MDSMNIFGQPIVMAKSEPFWAGDFGRQTQMKQSRRSNQTTRLNLIGYDKELMMFSLILKVQLKMSNCSCRNPISCALGICHFVIGGA